jgi:hypothetical protein
MADTETAAAIAPRVSRAAIVVGGSIPLLHAGFGQASRRELGLEPGSRRRRRGWRHRVENWKQECLGIDPPPVRKPGNDDIPEKGTLIRAV